jgi:hypothetical protein
LQHFISFGRSGSIDRRKYKSVLQFKYAHFWTLFFVIVCWLYVISSDTHSLLMIILYQKIFNSFLLHVIKSASSLTQNFHSVCLNLFSSFVSTPFFFLSFRPNILSHSRHVVFKS